MNNLNLSEEEVQNLSYQERCKLLNMNQILAARHFQFRVEAFFKQILFDGPLEKIKYYVIRVEFQVRGSPPMHSFLWFLIAPVLSEDTIDHFKEWVDSIISARLPNPTKNSKLFEFVKMYQRTETRKHVQNIKTGPAGLILSGILLKKLLLQNHYHYI